MQPAHTRATAREEPSPEQALHLLDRMMGKIDEFALTDRLAVSHRHSVRLPTYCKTISSHPIGERGLLLYESGWIIGEHGRTFTRIFLLSNKSWLIERNKRCNEPTVEYCETADLGPVLEATGFRGKKALLGIWKLLRLIRPRVRRCESWPAFGDYAENILRIN